jgi:steroid delta-isomerase-like uncharacterized protein
MRQHNLLLLLVLAAIVATIAACQAPSAPPPPDYGAEYGPAVEKFMEVWNSRQYDELDSFVSTNFRREAPDQNVSGLDAMKLFMSQVHTTYPDFSITTDDVWFADGVAFVRWTATGTNTGEGSFEPTGNSIDVSGLTMVRFDGGMISEEHAYFDTATVASQLGLEAVPHAM